ncbi:NAD(+) diphosphatase [Serratia ureilytica]
MGGCAGLAGARAMPRRWARVRPAVDLDRGLFRLAGRGVQLADSTVPHRYCGYCGHEMHLSRSESACLCGHRKERYPQIAPLRDRRHSARGSRSCWRNTRHRGGIHTVLAGFVEVGETLEQAVAREVMEESNIEIKKPALRHFTTLAVPALADDGLYDRLPSGEIRHDPKELLNAGWYRYDQLPLLPPPGTVARRLIEDTVALCRAE